MSLDFTRATLGELLTHTDQTIKRNALSILKVLQRNAGDKACQHDHDCETSPTACFYGYNAEGKPILR